MGASVTIGSRRRRVLTVLFPALLPPLQLFLFGPHTIYAGNLPEFSAPFPPIAAHLALPILAVAATLALVGLALPVRLFPSYVAGLVAVGLVLWAQGNLMVGDYGALTGREIEWSGHAWRTRYELPVWMLVPAAMVAAARWLWPTAVFLSRVVIVLQIALLAYSSAQADPESRATWQGPPEAIFELSSTQNVFHVVLDGFQSDVFHDILTTERAEIDRQFDGFTFFADHMGAFVTTIVSIPAMLTGSVYRNQEPIRPFVASAFRRASLFRALRDRGYQVDAVSILGSDRRSTTTHYRLPAPYVTYEAYTRFAAWQLADLSLFRHAPHALKPWVYNGQAWRLQAMPGLSAETSGRRYPPVNGQAFLADYTARVRVAHARRTYKYVHVAIPHWPVAVDADCEYIGLRALRRPFYTAQARCAVRRLGAFMDRLRALGVYDSSLILVSSDHGVALPPAGFTGDRNMLGSPLSELAGSALALLIVKPPGARGPVRVSYAPTTIGDVPSTIVATLGLEHSFPGPSALQVAEDAVRPRQFAVYPWSSDGWRAAYFPYLDVFTVEGRATDGSAWKAAESIYAPDAAPDVRTRGFHGPEVGAPGESFRWSAPVAFLHPPAGARGVELAVRSAADRPQTLTIDVRGTTVDRLRLADNEWHTVTWLVPPPASPSGGDAWITVRVDPPWAAAGDPRALGVMTRGLRWVY